MSQEVALGMLGWCDWSYMNIKLQKLRRMSYAFIHQVDMFQVLDQALPP